MTTPNPALASLIHADVAALAPIVGVSIGDPSSPATWLVTYSPAATPAQIASAQQFLSGKTADHWAPSPAQLRGDRYKSECDPMLVAIEGYNVELEAAPDQASKDAISAKRGPLVTAYIAAKAQIRKDIPG